MIRLSPFQYHAPESLDEACATLTQHAGDIKVLAGGTDLLPALKNSLCRCLHVLDLQKITWLKGIHHQGSTVTIGPLTTLAELESSAVVKMLFPALAEAAAQAAAPAIRSMGTLGGNIALETRCVYYNQPPLWHQSLDPCLKRGGVVCHAVRNNERCHAFSAADTVPALMAHSASLTIVSSRGRRDLPIRSLYRHDGKQPLHLSSDEIISAVTLPVPDSDREVGHASRYVKLRRRKALDFPLAAVAVNLSRQGTQCRDLTIVLGAVGSGPVLVEDAPHLACGRELSQALISELGELARRAARPVANAAASPSFRREMIGVLTRRILFDILTATGSAQSA